MTNEIFSGTLKTCSSCTHWNIDGSIISDDVMLCLCELGERGHTRKEHKEFMRGSDGCSKWERKNNSWTGI